ncbi:MAG TPA: flagellar hook-basal body complex protein FliE [Acetobacteraceae bacterium]|nr:flagellar hook-basal body complex protein FliE [Acetobacteraceae bacterium]
MSDPAIGNIPMIRITPSDAADAYARVDRGDAGGAAGGGFGAVLQNALDGAIETGHAAEGEAMQAIAGGGNLTDVVTALSRAELALQTATAIRDRVVQAYQDIMKMPI